MAINFPLPGVIAVSLLFIGSLAMSAEAPAQAPKPAERPYLCAPQSDSRLPASDRKCPQFGHSWTSQDIQRTGATTVGDALRLLDPTLTVHH
jgi:hypothetical protein